MIFRLIFALFLSSVLWIPRVEAGGCPKKPVAENGGKHWCFDGGATVGHVHLWKPEDFDAARGVTVVYIHGYNLTDGGGQVFGAGKGMDGCANAHYIDCAWDAHHLAKQFADSGLNALFVAIEGPNNYKMKPKWKQLGALLDSLQRRELSKDAPEAVVAVVHSAGIFTAAGFLKDDRLRHLVAIDAMYAMAPKKVRDWYDEEDGRLTLVGAEGSFRSTESVARKIECAEEEGLDVSLSRRERRQRCITLIDPCADHMDLIRAGKVLPLALSRIKTLPPQPETEAKKPRGKRRHGD